jgi:non-specific serine/threonine protein kinase/serine/threonine-protein kinase
LPLHNDPNSASPSAPTTDAWPPDPSSSDVADAKRLGDYLLLERIGEGGMAVVYKAQQTEPVQRIVALKLLKLGEESDVVARFASERQALAILDHPNIARIFDAGASPAGRPYFVMEYVSGGEPITASCDRQRLTIEQRLRLFNAVCDAVQHAHFKGIVHRDLKPSNVLVSEEGHGPTASGRTDLGELSRAATGVVKVIDFGIAKAVGADLKLSERTLHTQQGLLIGTPEYMSPEQAAGSEDVDTRTDVYSLGVLLYELLGGSLPLDIAPMRGRPIDEVLRSIRESDTPAPSTGLTRLADAKLTVIASRRGTDSASLMRSLKGDLDWIVLKAIEKDRSRRYASPGELSADIARHLNHQPVQARPPSRAYVMARFVRRHRVLVSAAAAVFLVLVLGIVGTSWGLRRAQAARRAEEAQRHRAETAADISNRVNKILTDMLAAPHPERALGKPVLVRDILSDAVKQLDALHDEPLVEAAVRHTIGTTYNGLGDYDAAYEQFVRSTEIRQRELGPDHPETISSMIMLAHVLNVTGRSTEAEPIARHALEAQRRGEGPDAPRAIEAGYQYAQVLQALGRFDEAIALMKGNVERAGRDRGEAYEHLDELSSFLGTMLRDAGRYAEAEAMLRAALDDLRKASDPDSPRVLTVEQELAQTIGRQERWEEAAALYRDVIERRTRVEGAEHPSTLTALNGYATILQNTGKFDEAEKTLRQVLEARQRVLGLNHPETLVSANNLLDVLRQRGQLADAEAMARDVIERRKHVLGDAHPATVTTMQNLAVILLAEGKPADAEPIFRDVLARRAAALGEDHPQTLNSRFSLAETLVREGKHADAEPLFANVVKAGRTRVGKQTFAKYLAGHGLCLAKLERWSQAQAPLREAYESLKDIKPPDRRVRPVLAALVKSCQAQGRSDEAGRWQALLDQLPPERPATTQQR